MTPRQFGAIVAPLMERARRWSDPDAEDALSNLLLKAWNAVQARTCPANAAAVRDWIRLRHNGEKLNVMRAHRGTFIDEETGQRRRRRDLSADTLPTGEEGGQNTAQASLWSAPENAIAPAHPTWLPTPHLKRRGKSNSTASAPWLHAERLEQDLQEFRELERLARKQPIQGGDDDGKS
jgi:hypothetical protein